MNGELAVASFSEIGRRDRNEDAHGSFASGDGTLRVFAVADGLGGHDHGEVASASAIAAIGECAGRADVSRLDSENGLEAFVADAMAAANDAVRAARAAAGRSEMATTLVLVALRGERVAYAHTGDSRIYRLRDGLLEALTRDHTVDARLGSLGGASRAPLPERSNTLLAAIDGGSLVFEGAPEEALLETDVFLLCSDGLWSTLGDNGMLVAATTAATLTEWFAAMRAAVESAGLVDQDNFTALGFAVRFVAPDAPEPRKERPLLRRIFGR